MKKDWKRMVINISSKSQCLCSCTVKFDTLASPLSLHIRHALKNGEVNCERGECVKVMKSGDDAASPGRLPFKVAAQPQHNKHTQPQSAIVMEFYYGRSLRPPLVADSSHAPDTEAPDTQQKQKSIYLIPRQTLINPRGRHGRSEEGKLWI